MSEQQINNLITELRRKDSKLLPKHEFFIRAILAQRLEDEKEDFIDHPFFTDEDDILEALLKEISTNY
jgi:hypothetical protein